MSVAGELLQKTHLRCIHKTGSSSSCLSCTRGLELVTYYLRHMMKNLTDTQKKVLDALLLEPERTNGRICVTSVAERLRLKIPSLTQHIRAIAAKGHLEYTSNGPGRAPTIDLPARALGVPLVGAIPAGPVAEAVQQPEGFLQLPSNLTRKRFTFALRVDGDSMADLIQDGDVVLLRNAASFRSGDICAVRVGGTDATLKYVDHNPNHPEVVLLRPHNRTYKTLEVSRQDVQIDGVYGALLRGDVVDVLLES
jgi:repressor LexA